MHYASFSHSALRIVVRFSGCRPKEAQERLEGCVRTSVSSSWRLEDPRYERMNLRLAGQWIEEHMAKALANDFVFASPLHHDYDDDETLNMLEEQSTGRP